MGDVLILSREEIVAALLGLMVELQGLRPRFLGSAETVDDAIRSFLLPTDPDTFRKMLEF